MRLNAEDSLLAKLLPGLPVGEGLVLGPGDDCAAVHVAGGRGLVLLKTDCIAEDVHFLRAHDPARVGWKAICRPLSDIAAMGGTPAHALVTIFSPPEIGEEYWKAFYRGLGRAARKFGVNIAGGELSRQRAGIAVSVALTGHVSKRHLVTRSGGKPGDLLFVTGKLGGSIASHHLDFVPRLAEGRWLARNFHPHAMMDLSDGLGGDLPRLARASGCGFEVDLESLPLRRGCDVAAGLSDGEDYELLFALPSRRAADLLRRWSLTFSKVALTCIGALNSSSESPPDWPGGWDHFSIAGEPPLGQVAAGQNSTC